MGQFPPTRAARRSCASQSGTVLSELFCPGSELSPRPMSVRGPPAYLSVSSRATLVYTSRLMDDGDYTRGGVERGECECGLRVRTLRPHSLRNSVCLKRDPNPRERERSSKDRLLFIETKY